MWGGARGGAPPKVTSSRPLSVLCVGLVAGEVAASSGGVHAAVWADLGLYTLRWLQWNISCYGEVVT